ncbi:unnamed protein product [Cunninghamella echinulata]
MLFTKPLIHSTRVSFIIRGYSTAIKPNIKLLSKLRQETEVSMSKAKEALVKNNNNYDLALTWLQEDALVSGAKKAAKVANRIAGEGLISTASVNMRSTIIELNCETDFVSRNSVFKNLASRIAATSLLMHEPTNLERAIETIPIDTLLKSPLMPEPTATETTTTTTNIDEDEDLGKTVEEMIVKTIGILGENITLRRAAVVNKGISASYLHGGDQSTGKIGGVAVLKVNGNTNPEQSELIHKTARQIARQVVGFHPKYLNEQDIPLDDEESQNAIKDVVLNQQGYMMNPSQTVEEYVKTVAEEQGIQGGAQVIDFIRWEAGENIEKKVNNFTEEVMKAAKL